jgi:hypothetical protein
MLEAFGAGVEAAMARGVVDLLAGRQADAAVRIEAALKAAPAGTSAGWTLPVEPLVRMADHPAAWAGVAAMLRDRAA